MISSISVHLNGIINWMHSIIIDNVSPIVITVFSLRKLGNFHGNAKPNGINNAIFPPLFTIKFVGCAALNKIVLNGIRFIPPLLTPIPSEG